MEPNPHIWNPRSFWDLLDNVWWLIVLWLSVWVMVRAAKSAWAWDGRKKKRKDAPSDAPR
jgi:hypothetical protein